MKFIKAFLNALVCGLFFCCLLALLLADLNVNSSLSLPFLGQAILILFPVYGLAVTLVCFLSFSILHFLLPRRSNIAWLSPSFLIIGFTVLVFLFLLIFRENTAYFRSFFSVKVQSLLRTQMHTLLFLGLLGLVIFVGRLSVKKGAWLIVAYFFFFAGAMTYTFSRRPEGGTPPPPERTAHLEGKRIEKRVTVIGLEGLSFNFIIPLISEDKLPNFSFLVKQGSWGRLENFTPATPLILNTSFNTGKLPSKHRSLSLFTYRLGHLPQMLEVLPRFIFFNQLTRTGLLKLSPGQPTVAAKDIWQIFAENKTALLKKDWPYAQEGGKPSQKSETLLNHFFRDFPDKSSYLFSIARQAFLRDAEYEEAAFQERAQDLPQLYCLFLNGLNTVESYFYQYSFPDLFGTVPQEDIRKYGQVIERYYQFYDQVIGKYLASLKEEELFIVYSPHGIEPLPAWRRVVEWAVGNPNLSATQEHAPDGAVFFYGKNILRERNIESIRLIDIAPTILYYLGMPVGKDMDGFVRSSLFVKEFTAENPVFYISSYEEVAIKPLPEHP